MTVSRAAEPAKTEIILRPLQERDLPEADRIMRLAFGTFIGLPDPSSFMGDASYVASRWKADPTAAFAAELDGELVGSNFASNWGSIGFFGPLTVRPDVWDRGVGRLLMGPIQECFDKWKTKHAGLFTFAQSQKHVGLYQKFGFWPRFLTAIMSKAADKARPRSDWHRFSALTPSEQTTILHSCFELTNQIYNGLDVRAEIHSVASQKLGDTVLVYDNDTLVAVAVCHMGPGTEAGSGVCYIKFGAARPGTNSAANFARLLEACEELAAPQDLRIVAGVNTARHEAYQHMLVRGFRTDLQGVAMHRPNEAAYNRPGVYLIDDWR